jgi:exo-1,4-beta-D-glucosaminidase
MKQFITFLFLLLLIDSTAQDENKMILSDGWQMQSSLTDKAGGKEISQEGFAANSWYNVSVPTTIVAGLIANKEFDFDPFYGKNLEKISGERFDHPWWFRKIFELPATEKNKTVILTLHGINYKANLWVNGVLVKDSSAIKGPFRIFDLDITKLINKEGKNVIALEILRPFNPNKKDGDLAIDYADWIHYPADFNAGIVNNVSISTYDRVAVRYPLVTTRFNSKALTVAHLTVDAEVVNYSGEAQDVTIKGKINNNINFEQKVHLNPNETKSITFTPTDYKQLNIENPHIWWPWQYGNPDLNTITLQSAIKENINNTIKENFGIREITSVFISNDAREFIINGKPIMLRGAAWSPDIFQRRSAERQEQEIKLVRDMNMNIIRSEGKFEDNNFYDLCDKYGLLVMTGWMCCGSWQYPKNWSAEERNVAMESERSVMYWLRNKACMLSWLNGSDMPPTDTSVESDYLAIEKELKWPNPILATANEGVSKVSGKSGVKMAGPYDWVPPVYWETDPHKNGGAWSFATEISPGPSIPPYESLIKFIPKDSLWYTNSEWLYHCGTMEFGHTKIFNEALNNRYGNSTSIKEFVDKAQAQNYESHRAMMEAYGLNKYNTATGVVQWMLSNPWPGLIWHTYDYYLYPAGTYFGMKKSMEPLHVQYSYKSNEVIINNSLLKSFNNLTVKAAIYDINGVLKYDHSFVTSAKEDAITKCFVLPAIKDLNDVYFLRLELTDADNKTNSINWYWLSHKQDVLNWNKSTWFYTPQSAYTDLSGLQRLPKTSLKTEYTTTKNELSTTQHITITNTGKAVAFFVHLRALKGKDGDDILPVIFDDNYFSLAPGESRMINCSYENKNAGNVEAYILTTAWNVASE